MTLFYGTWTWRWIWTLSPGQDIRHFIECSYLDLIAEHLAAPSVRNSAAAVWSVVILFLEKRSHFLVGCLTPLLFSELKTAVPSFRGRQVWTKFGAKFQNGSTRLYCWRKKPSIFGWIRSCLLLLWLLLVSPRQVSVAFIGSHKRCDPASFSCRIHQVAHEGSLIVINLFVFGRNNTLDGAQCAQVAWELRENFWIY